MVMGTVQLSGIPSLSLTFLRCGNRTALCTLHQHRNASPRGLNLFEGSWVFRKFPFLKMPLLQETYDSERQNYNGKLIVLSEMEPSIRPSFKLTIAFKVSQEQGSAAPIPRNKTECVRDCESVRWAHHRVCLHGTLWLLCDNMCICTLMQSSL